jgi:hypothetical protein
MSLESTTRAALIDTDTMLELPIAALETLVLALRSHDSSSEYKLPMHTKTLHLMLHSSGITGEFW